MSENAAMSAFVVHPNPAAEEITRLVKLLRSLGQQVALVPRLSDLPENPAYVAGRRNLVLVADTEPGADSSEMVIGFASAESPRAYVIYIADALSADAYKRLIRTGTGEWVNWQGLDRELPELLRRVGDGETERPDAVGSIVSFLPSKGGVGNTTLSLEVATALISRKRKGRGIAVVDLNFQSSTLADYLDVEPRLEISEIMGRPDRLDQQLIELFASRHRSGLDIFSAPPRLIDYELFNSQAIFSLLDQVSRRYDLVILDLPSFWFPWIDNVITGSDAVVITGGCNVPSVRQLAHRVRHLDDIAVPAERVAVVINQCEATLLGRIPRTSEIGKSFAGRHVMFVRRNTKLAAESADTGRPMMQASAPRGIRADLKRLRDWVEKATSRSRIG